GEQPIHWAVEQGRLEILRVILADAEVDVNCMTSYGYPPLVLASAKRGHSRVVKILLENGRVDVNQKDIWGSTAFGLAFFYRKADVVTLLLNDPRVEVRAHDSDIDYRESPNIGESLLHHAARDGDCAAKLTRALLEDAKGRFNVNQLDNQGRTPLHLASFNGGVNLMKLLVWESRVDVNVVDIRGQTALHVACMAGNSYAVRILLTHPDIDVNA
ncbi:ankyrin, partial [Tuber magnatum]